VKFFGTTLLLGAASVLALHACADGADLVRRIAPSLGFAVLVVTIVKLALEGAVLHAWRDPRHSVAKRMAVVMLGDLRTVTEVRFACGVAGGIVGPLLLWRADFSGSLVAPISVLMLVALVASELGERYLVFRAAPASRMPGDIR